MKKIVLMAVLAFLFSHVQAQGTLSIANNTGCNLLITAYAVDGSCTWQADGTAQTFGPGPSNYAVNWATTPPSGTWQYGYVTVTFPGAWCWHSRWCHRL